MHPWIWTIILVLFLAAGSWYRLKSVGVSRKTIATTGATVAFVLAAWSLIITHYVVGMPWKWL